MKNFKNIFTEYQDPRVIRNFKWGSVLLIVLGILITFVAVPPVRHLVLPEGHVGKGEAVTKQHTPPRRDKFTPGKGKDSQRPSKRKSQLGSDNPSTNGNIGGGGQPGGSGGGGNGAGNPAIPGDPGTPPSPQAPGAPAPNSPESPNGSGGGNGGNGNGGSNNGGGNNNVPPVIKLPSTPLDPVIEGVGGTVNETVNGVTGTTNEITGKLPVQVEVPKVCVLKPC